MCRRCQMVESEVERRIPGGSSLSGGDRRMLGEQRERVVSDVLDALAIEDIPDGEREQIATPWDLIVAVRLRCVEGHFSPAGDVHCARRGHFTHTQHVHGRRVPGDGLQRPSLQWVLSRIVARCGPLSSTT